MLDIRTQVEAIAEEVSGEHLLYNGTDAQAHELRSYREYRDTIVRAAVSRPELAETLREITKRVSIIVNEETRRFFFLLFLSEHPAVQEALNISLDVERESGIHSRIRGNK